MPVMKIIAPALALSLLAVAVSGCVSASVTVGRDESIDLTAIKKVAVVPFENLATDRLAGDKVTAIFISGLSKLTRIEIVDPGEMLKALAENGYKKDKLTALQIKKIGSKIKAQALIFGSVEEYTLERLDNVTLPVVSLSARMVDVGTGKVLWVATASDSGLSRMPIINVGETRTKPALAAKVIEMLIREVYYQ